MPGNMPTPGAGQSAATAGAGAIPADTSMMPSSGGSYLAYLHGPGLLAPTDALVARASHAVAVCNAGNVIRSDIPIFDFNFTTDGGMPTIGAPVYIAASNDDTNTGIGKLTATRPALGISSVALQYPQVFPKNPVRVGICLDNSQYVSSKTCVVLLSLPAGPQPPVEADQAWSANALSGLSPTKYFSTVGNAESEFTFHDQETVVVMFTLDNESAVTGQNWLWANCQGYANGWGIVADPLKVWQFGTSTTGLNVPGLRSGLNCLAATVVNGTLRASANGNSPVSTPIVGSIIDPTSSCVHSLGGFVDGFGVGSILAVAKLGRAAEDTELAAWTGIVSPVPPANRFALPSSIVNDYNLQWYWAASDWAISQTPSGIAGPLGTDFLWTVHPDLSTGPTVQTLTENWYRNILPYHVDTEPCFYDSRGYTRSDAGARVAFHISALRREVCFAVTNDDTDNDDQGFALVLVDGVPFAYPHSPPNGNVTYVWVNNIGGSTPASHLIEFVIPDKEQRPDTGGWLKGGTCLVEIVADNDEDFATSATSNRLVLVGDGTFTGHDTGNPSPMMTSVSTLLRQDYPGRVTVHAATSRSLYEMWTLGNNSIVPFGREIIEAANEGSAATINIYINLGFHDYSNPPETVSAFQAKYASLVDFLHAQQPSWGIYAQKLIQANYDAVPNSNGETLAQYNAAIDTVASTRSWLINVNARVPNSIAFTFVSGVYEPSQPAGTTAWKANIKAIVYP